MFGSLMMEERRGRCRPTAGWTPGAVDGRNDDDVVVDDDAVVVAGGVVANSMAQSPEAEFAGRYARLPRPTGVPPHYRDPPGLRTLFSPARLGYLITLSRVSSRAARGPRCPPPRPWVLKRPRNLSTPRDPTCSLSRLQLLSRYPQGSLLSSFQLRSLLITLDRCFADPHGDS